MSDPNGRRRGRDWRGAELLGIVLIALGVVYLLGSLGVVVLAWGVIWPILIIAVGALILYSAFRPSRRTASNASVERGSSARLELAPVSARVASGSPRGRRQATWSRWPPRTMTSPPRSSGPATAPSSGSARTSPGGPMRGVAGPTGPSAWRATSRPC